jgi:hypothetical protein
MLILMANGDFALASLRPPTYVVSTNTDPRLGVDQGRRRQMAYYAFQHRYGSNMRDEAGDLIGTLRVFSSRLTRDAWVADGNPYLNNPGARTPVKSRYAAKFIRMSTAVEYAGEAK